MNPRNSAAMFCALGWLLASSAAMADPNWDSGKTANAYLRPMRADFSRPSDTLPPPDMNFRINNRRKIDNQRFPSSPPLGAARNDNRPSALDLLGAYASDPTDLAPRNSGPFRFERNGGVVVRDVPRAYRHMCDSLSGHVWDNPNGKRLCFDVRGKPGLAIQIPIR